MTEDARVMRDRLQTLTGREKETLRLLVEGHGAKSIARELGLSVHTVNERLRDTRRKLHVSSSREAARLLADHDRSDPDLVVDKQMGVVTPAASVPHPDQAGNERYGSRWAAWFAGGMLVMSLIIAAIIFASLPQAEAAKTAPSPSTFADADQSAGLSAARRWLALADRQQWDESWQASAGVFRSQVSTAQWGAMIQRIRQALGTVTGRRFETVTKATSLPNAPAGDYEIIQFRTDFTQRQAATETVILAHETDGWKVAGYFIK